MEMSTTAEVTIIPPPPHASCLRLPPIVTITICDYSTSPHETYAIAALFRLPRAQAAALVELHEESLDRIGSVAALDFLLRHLRRERLDELYREDAMNCAESVDVLQWWRDCGLEHRYTDSAIHRASEKGLISLLQWWKDSGLSLRYTSSATHYASRKGRVEVLQWWKDSGLEFKYDGKAMAGASLHGHVHVLQWWKDSGFPLKYDRRSEWSASVSGSTEVLQWWKDSGLEFKCNGAAMTRVTRDGKIHVLQWWKDSGYELKYTPSHCVGAAISKGQVECLQWWKDNGLGIDWFVAPFANAEQVEVLEWWEATGLFARWAERQENLREAFDNVLNSREISRKPEPVENWWRKRSGEHGQDDCGYRHPSTLFRLPRHQTSALLDLHHDLHRINSAAVLDFLVRHLQRERLDGLYSEDAMDFAESVDVLQWWLDCWSCGTQKSLSTERSDKGGARHCSGGKTAEFRSPTMKKRCAWHRQKAKVDVLQWWRDSGLELMCDKQAIRNASAYGHVHVLQWWKDSGLSLKYDEEAAFSASYGGHTGVLQRLKDTGLESKCDKIALEELPSIATPMVERQRIPLAPPPVPDCLGRT